MEIKATARFIRISPRKVRLVVDVVRGKKAEEALSRLEFLNKISALAVKKLLISAIANAKHNLNIEKDNLYIKAITVDEGPKLKRYMPKAHGRATPIRKRMSHINLTLGELVETSVKKTVVKKEKAAAEKTEKIVGKRKDAKKGGAEEAKPKISQTEGEKPEIFDVRMKGKHRNNQHQDAKRKGEKKFWSKVFNRKSGM